MVPCNGPGDGPWPARLRTVDRAPGGATAMVPSVCRPARLLRRRQCRQRALPHPLCRGGSVGRDLAATPSSPSNTCPPQRPLAIHRLFLRDCAYRPGLGLLPLGTQQRTPGMGPAATGHRLHSAGLDPGGRTHQPASRPAAAGPSGCTRRRHRVVLASDRIIRPGRSEARPARPTLPATAVAVPPAGLSATLHPQRRPLGSTCVVRRREGAGSSRSANLCLGRDRQRPYAQTSRRRGERLHDPAHVAKTFPARLAWLNAPSHNQALAHGPAHALRACHHAPCRGAQRVERRPRKSAQMNQVSPSTCSAPNPLAAALAIRSSCDGASSPCRRNRPGLAARPLCTSAVLCRGAKEFDQRGQQARAVRAAVGAALW